MNYKMILKRDNREIKNEVLNLEQLNSSIRAFYKCINTNWKDANITLSITATKEKALSDEEFMETQLDNIIKMLSNILGKE